MIGKSLNPEDVVALPEETQTLETVARNWLRDYVKWREGDDQMKYPGDLVNLLREAEMHGRRKGLEEAAEKFAQMADQANTYHKIDGRTSDAIRADAWNTARGVALKLASCSKKVGHNE